MSKPIRLVLGTMTFGPQVDLEGSREMVRRFLDAGHSEIDTAYVYNKGDSEKYLGTILADEPRAQATIATKVNPRITGRLDAASIAMQVKESLARLRRDSIDLLYLHFPDPQTPIEITLEACADLHAQGLFSSFGLSNFPAWEVVHVWHTCKRNGWPLPEVYQGLYNGLSRSVEPELLPALRQLGMLFYAYNPLAGGLLAGKHAKFEEAPAPGRFTLRPNYRNRYWKKPFFDAMRILSDECAQARIRPVEAAYRWLAFHSGLDGTKGDGVIIGASSPAQLEENLGSLKAGPLPEGIAEAFRSAWDDARADSPSYFRYSG